MTDNVATFMAVTGAEDIETARRFLDLTAGDLDYAVTLYLESGPSAMQDPPQHSEPLVRPLDSLVHKHETLADSFGPSSNDPFQSRSVFSRNRTGIFDQQYDSFDHDFNDDQSEINQNFGSNLRSSTFLPSTHPFSSSRFHRNIVEIDDDDEDNDEDEDEIMHIDSESYPESDDDVRIVSQTPPTNSQQRLAQLFRPPFDILSRLNLDQARALGKSQLRWILINIQDPSEFQCQVINRDFWSNSKVKNLVRENFILLQFPCDSANGESYLNFYQALSFPHIAILDPLTGERVKVWEDGKVPDLGTWCHDIDKFLDTFSLDPGSNNPIVHHDTPIDPDALSEEQQIALALKQSLAGSSVTKPVSESVEHPPVEDTAPPLDAFDKIEAVNHIEPDSGTTTRIQFRFPNGKRLVHKFATEEEVLVIIQWLKSIAGPDYGLVSGGRFAVSNSANRSFKFIDSLDTTIESAGLKNASVLVEQE